ncbi:hypothetical protein [Vibrio metschnikovii]|uniref:hypothetical protein n=1 Tax=Vibrio metschnikovii TaxID=28172 RepID=UPI00193BD84E|nr:hypothetical protein [Vibrio metschnikovii]
MQEYEAEVYHSAIVHFQQTLTSDELRQLEQLLMKACRDLDLGAWSRLSSPLVLIN